MTEDRNGPAREADREEEPVRDPAHALALGAMVLTPLVLAGLVYGVLKALGG